MALGTFPLLRTCSCSNISIFLSQSHLPLHKPKSCPVSLSAGQDPLPVVWLAHRLWACKLYFPQNNAMHSSSSLCHGPSTQSKGPCGKWLWVYFRLLWLRHSRQQAKPLAANGGRTGTERAPWVLSACSVPWPPGRSFPEMLWHHCHTATATAESACAGM